MGKRAFSRMLIAVFAAGCQNFYGVQAPELDWGKATLREAKENPLELTLYADNWALVTDARPLAIEAGNQAVRFSEVPPQTVARGAYLQLPSTVNGRRFLYDLQNREHLLERYDGKTVGILMKGATTPVDAVLIWTANGAVYRIGDRLYPEAPGKVSLPDLPGLALSPSLEWLIESPSTWSGMATASYVVERLGWSNEYTLITDRSQSRGAWKQWAALSNNSGKAYRDSQVTLVAGDVKRISVPMFYGGARAFGEAITAEPFAGRYLYRIPGKISLAQGAEERLALNERNDFPLEKIYLVESGIGLFPIRDKELPRKARIRLLLDNPFEKPMPGGKVTVYTPDNTGKLILAGEPSIPDSPKKQRIILDLGEAFDVTAERVQTSYQLSEDTQEIAYRITLSNSQEDSANVEVVEMVSGDWTVTESNHPYEKISSTQLKFKTSVPAGKEVVLTYSVSVKREGRP